MQTQVARTTGLEWQPLNEEGVDTTGISMKPMRLDERGRPQSFLLRFEPGATYPAHNHPAGEEVFVLAGEASFDSIDLRAGDYLYTPPGQRHAVSSKTGCELFFVVPAEVEILP